MVRSLISEKWVWKKFGWKGRICLSFFDEDLKNVLQTICKV